MLNPGGGGKHEHPQKGHRKNVHLKKYFDYTHQRYVLIGNHMGQPSISAYKN